MIRSVSPMVLRSPPKRVNVRGIEESELLLERFVKNIERGCLIDLETKCHGAKAQGWDLKS